MEGQDTQTHTDLSHHISGIPLLRTSLGWETVSTVSLIEHASQRRTWAEEGVENSQSKP